MVENEILPRDWNFGVELLERFLAPVPTERPSVWCENNIVFADSDVKGRFDFTGREYLRDPLDDNNDPSVYMQTMCFGTGCGKTITYIGGVCYKIVHRQPRGLWVMPATKGAAGVENFNKTRLQTTFKASPVMKALLPSGAQRFDVNSVHVRMNGAVYDFAGANSAGQLASNRCSDIRLDEVDKFKDELGGEAGPAEIAETRTDGVADPQVFLASTPSLDTKGIWQSLLTSSLQRRFIPCPHCGRHHPSSRNFVMIWSPEYTVLPKKFFDGRDIPLASVTWDQEARRKDGTWDLDRVERSARVECPHCGGHIRDEHMTWCDQNGIWIPTMPDQATHRHKGYHLPSMYAPRINFKATFGGRARQFLDAVEKGKVKAFIQSVTAEPEAAQGQTGLAIEIVSPKEEKLAEQWEALLTMDVQQNWPYFWFVVRNWLKWVLRPDLWLQTPEQWAEFAKTFSDEQKALAEKLFGEKRGETLPILCDLVRFPRWTEAAGWLCANGVMGGRLIEFYKGEFQEDTLRLVEFIAKQLNLSIGRQGDSEALAIGHFDYWEDADEIQKQFGVQNINVVVDSGWGNTEHAGVYAECFKRAQTFGYYHPVFKKFFPTAVEGSMPFAIDGWLPSKGFPKEKRWRDRNRIVQPYEMHIDDPFKGTSEANKYLHYVFQFSSPHFLDQLEHLRSRGRNRWAVSENVKLLAGWKDEGADSVQSAEVSVQKKTNPMTFAAARADFNLEEYSRHLQGKYKRDGEWHERGRNWPDHLLDCEKIQKAFATFKGIFEPPLARKEKKK